MATAAAVTTTDPDIDALKARLRDAIRKLPPRSLPLVPPLSFALVSDGVYRSGHPLPLNFPMLERLKLKTIVYLADTPYASENVAWCKRHDIAIYHHMVQAVREPFLQNNAQAVRATLSLLLDKRNFPILLHSNKGKHRVGVLVGCMRKILQNWSLAAIFGEYGRFSGDKGDADLEFIELFEPDLLVERGEHSPGWLVEREKGVI